MDQFLISRTSDSLNKGSIVETGRRCSLFTGLFARTRTQLGAGLPPPPRPLSPKEVTCVAHRTDFGCQPTPKSLVLLGRGEGVPKAWFSSVIDGKTLPYQ